MFCTPYIKLHSHTSDQDYYPCKIALRELTLTLETTGSLIQVNESELLRLQQDLAGKKINKKC